MSIDVLGQRFSFLRNVTRVVKNIKIIMLAFKRVREEASRLNSLASRFHDIREINERPAEACSMLHALYIPRVDCGLLTRCTSRCGKCTAENIGMRPKEARDERIARACSYVRARHCVCLASLSARGWLQYMNIQRGNPRRLYCSFFAFAGFMREEGTAACRAIHQRPPPAKFGNHLN